MTTLLEEITVKAHELERELEREKHKTRVLAAEVERAEEDAARLRAQLAMVVAEGGSVWHWQGDGGDAPESLSCPVVMSAERLRELCEARDAFSRAASAALVERQRMEFTLTLAQAASTRALGLLRGCQEELRVAQARLERFGA